MPAPITQPLHSTTISAPLAGANAMSLPFLSASSGAVPLQVDRDVPIKTWFGVGGKAHQYAIVRDLSQLQEALTRDPNLRVLGDGANLLVDDQGVDGLVVKFADTLCACTIDDKATGRVFVGAGAHLFKVMNTSVAAGLGGLEVLAGVPACMGGAIVMNAGGAFGQIADVVHRVFALRRDDPRTLLEIPRDRIAFSYRHSGLNDLVIVGAELKLVPGDVSALELRKREINDYKRRTQPMSACSAGCCFKNPVLAKAIEGIGNAGDRVSAGKLIDIAGLKGTTHGSAIVSPLHGNFLLSSDPATGNARDVIELIERVQRSVHEKLGVQLEREVVIW